MDNQAEKKKSWLNRHSKWVVGGVILFFIILVSSSGDDNSNLSNSESPLPQQEQQVVAMKISAETLRQAYKANVVSGDNQYKDKFVEISGTIETIGKDILEDAYITFEPNEQYAFDKVQCMFKSSEEGPLGTLKKGQKITLQGTVSGGGVVGGVRVLDCKVISSQ